MVDAGARRAVPRLLGAHPGRSSTRRWWWGGGPSCLVIPSREEKVVGARGRYSNRKKVVLQKTRTPPKKGVMDMCFWARSSAGIKGAYQEFGT